MEHETDPGQQRCPEPAESLPETYQSPELRVIGTVEEMTQILNDNPSDTGLASSDSG
jgi:hypothetical protein